MITLKYDVETDTTTLDFGDAEIITSVDHNDCFLLLKDFGDRPLTVTGSGAVFRDPTGKPLYSFRNQEKP